MREQFKEVLAGQLLRHEGLELKLYKCPAGKWTIGAGRNLEDRGITEEEALYLLRNDIEISIDELINTFPWFARLDEVRQMALVDLHFNLGLNTLKTFRKTLSLIEQAIEGKVPWSEVSIELLNSKWATQVGRRSQTIANMIDTGEV
tara:strand:+ start:105 stop:545 length:441 start_codon:yes stop_codon:yes gene_type:complete